MKRPLPASPAVALVWLVLGSLLAYYLRTPTIDWRPARLVPAPERAASARPPVTIRLLRGLTAAAAAVGVLALGLCLASIGLVLLRRRATLVGAPAPLEIGSMAVLMICICWALVSIWRLRRMIAPEPVGARRRI